MYLRIISILRILMPFSIVLNPDYILSIIHFFNVSSQHPNFTFNCEELVVCPLVGVIYDEIGRCAEDNFLAILQIIVILIRILESRVLFNFEIDSI